MDGKINFVEAEYKRLLTISDLLEDSENSFKEYFNIDKDDMYTNLNPFRFNKFNSAQTTLRVDILKVIESIFSDNYKNVPHRDIEERLEECIKLKINEYDHKEKSLIIDFKKIRKTIEKLEKEAEEISKKDIIKKALTLIPYKLLRDDKYNKRKFEVEEILNKDKLILYCGYSWNRPNTENVIYLNQLINAILNKKDFCNVQDNMKNINAKYYKNGRVDIFFNNKEEAKIIAEYLFKNQKEVL